jgi:hypothetical protein
MACNCYFYYMKAAVVCLVNKQNICYFISFLESQCRKCLVMHASDGVTCFGQQCMCKNKVDIRED